MGKKNILMMRLLAGSKYLANEPIRWHTFCHCSWVFLISKFNSHKAHANGLLLGPLSVVFDMGRSLMLISSSHSQLACTLALAARCTTVDH